MRPIITETGALKKIAAGLIRIEARGTKIHPARTFDRLRRAACPRNIPRVILSRA
jgi:hypothetical protein